MPVKNNKKDNYRVTLDFSKESQQYIEELQKRANCNTKAEVFKQALNVFDFVIEELLNGSKFLLETNGDQKEIVFPIMLAKSTFPKK